MLPCFISVYKCPKCGKIIKCGNLLLTYTFGHKIFSDGKRVAPMIPDYPEIIKCKECKTFYWLKDENEVDKYEFSNDKINEKWENADEAELLTLDEYNEAISSKIYNNEDEEKYLRIKLWWAFNDRIREDKEIFISNTDKAMYESNSRKLIDIIIKDNFWAFLDKDNMDELIMCAELYRNLGLYWDCDDLLDHISNDYLWIREILLNECVKNNKKVIELTPLPVGMLPSSDGLLYRLKEHGLF
jgi:hypothetical protein